MVRKTIGALLMIGIMAAYISDAAAGTKAEGVADHRPFDVPLAVNAKHQRLALGMQVSVGVKDDGTVWSWGTASYGEFGTGVRSGKHPAPEQIEGLNEIVEVSGRGYHFLALRKDGAVLSWGYNEQGQLGYPTEGNIGLTPRQIPSLRGIVSVSAALSHSLALDSEGNVYGFGGSDSAQLGDHVSANPQRKPSSVVTPIIGKIPDAVRVIAGTANNAVLTETGSLWLMGSNSLGQLGCAAKGARAIKDLIQCEGIFVSDVSLGNTTTYLLGRDGFVWAMGYNAGGQLGRGYADQKSHQERERVRGLGRVVAIAAAISSAYALDESGRLWGWGESAGGPSVAGHHRKDWVEPGLIARIERPISMVGGSGRAAVMDADGYVNFVGNAEAFVRGTGESKIKRKAEDSLIPQRSVWMWK